MLYPLTLRPIFKERVWGGRSLERLYQKALPSGVPIGESWEIADRPEDQSVITNGPLAGKTLSWLMENQPRELLGAVSAPRGRFPLLVKILDAQDKLSLQVHPPAGVAHQLGGEPKTEMWYVAHAAPGALLYVGLRRAMTREQFERELASGTVAECFHQIPVQTGDAMFLPSGRVHAIGGGLVLVEIQQNSDTTYRVFDWNRPGLDGSPRALHVAEALASIDFTDQEPELVRQQLLEETADRQRWLLVDCPWFRVALVHSQTGFVQSHPTPGWPIILGVLQGGVEVDSPTQRLALRPGEFVLLPAEREPVTLVFAPQTRFLEIHPR